MNSNQINGILRAVVPALTAILAGSGYFPGESAGQVVAAILAMGAAVWSVYSNRTTPTTV